MTFLTRDVFFPVVSSCTSNPCLHGGTCIDTYFLHRHHPLDAFDFTASPEFDGYREREYVCKCVQPYSGPNCGGWGSCSECRYLQLAHSLTHSLRHALPPSLSHLLARSLARSPPHSHPTNHPPTHPLIHSITLPLTDWLTDWLTHWLTRSLTHSLPLSSHPIHSIIRPTNQPPTHRPTYPPTRSLDRPPTHSGTHSLHSSIRSFVCSFTVQRSNMRLFQLPLKLIRCLWGEWRAKRFMLRVHDNLPSRQSAAVDPPDDRCRFCSPHAECILSHCVCNEGYHGDGKTCTSEQALRECRPFVAIETRPRRGLILRMGFWPRYGGRDSHFTGT